MKLEDVNPQDIENDALLFDEGPGLDSLDAVEPVVLLQRHFGLSMQDQEEARRTFGLGKRAFRLY
ncbi:MAG: phosphopantetheine-binding protein [Desulfovibrio sp.]|nr:phosphopantetheine-binding protein [Desulfovibrio sp.]